MRVHEIVDYKAELITPYTLEDGALLDHARDTYAFRLFSPADKYIVLGRGSDPALTINENYVRHDGISVMKRPSGGEAIFLSPGMLIIAIVKGGEKTPSSGRFFNLYTDILIRALSSLNISGLTHEGTSDICINSKKVLGSSMYISKSRVFYHAVLNINESPLTIARYLRHPPREPEYRQHRTHADFVTSIVNEGYAVSQGDVIEKLEPLLQELN